MSTRPALLLVCLGLTAACRSEPDFDARFEAQANRIDTSAGMIERELGEQINASVAAGRIRTDPNMPESMTNRAAP